MQTLGSRLVWQRVVVVALVVASCRHHVATRSQATARRPASPATFCHPGSDLSRSGSGRLLPRDMTASTALEFQHIESSSGVRHSPSQRSWTESIKASIAVPLLVAVLGFGTSAMAAGAPAACVDIDSASAKDLESLKGVGPVLSKRIIDYRKAERTSATKDGRKTWNFQNWATLMKVDGVSQQICNDNISTACFSGKVQKSCPMPK
mmetsp:Transcript_130613/g.325917  ORF Transcript_130613/g.325917 Transcript_130613/m.325917 type:complete len:207 (-) Transcript_130613:74-694(-)